jgi:hypothetical protein
MSVEHGYVIVPGVLGEEQIGRYKLCAREIALGAVPESAANRVVRDIQYAKGHLPMPEDPEHAVWKILNPDVFGPQDQCVGVWIPLDPVSEANGGLTIIPGSQNQSVHKHKRKAGINFGALAAEGVEGNAAFHDQGITPELPAGDCILFNTRLLHRTGGNRTPGHRRVVTLHITSARCKAKRHVPGDGGFVSVRGQTYEGCLQPVEERSLRLEALKSKGSGSA